MESCEFRKFLLSQAFCAAVLSDCSPEVLNQTVRFAHQCEMTPAVEQKKSPFIYLVIYTQTKVVYFKKSLPSSNRRLGNPGIVIPWSILATDYE